MASEHLDRAARGWLAALGAIDTPTVANAVEAFGVRPATQGYALLELCCPFFGSASSRRLCGDVHGRQHLPGESVPSQDVAHFHALAAAPEPAIVAIQDVSTERSRSPARPGRSGWHVSDT